MTKLFLKFGDLKQDIRIGINYMDDPYAFVEFTDPAVARRLFEFQNRTGHPKEKIKFGGRTLSIQLSKQNM